MYLYLGQDTVINSKDVIGIFDLDNTSVSKRTRDYLKLAQQSGKVATVSPEIPKSFVVCDECVYLSQLSPATLKKRSKLQNLI
ncbi:MAG: DUF370 domain-containing protein [Oscillospiraceae bacterium]|nr:DUF370 domain-containing protein [Oscillospiraceae bacterium]